MQHAKLKPKKFTVKKGCFECNEIFTKLSAAAGQDMDGILSEAFHCVLIYIHLSEKNRVSIFEIFCLILTFDIDNVNIDQRNTYHYKDHSTRNMPAFEFLKNLHWVMR